MTATATATARRRGFTLIEMVAVITILGTLLGLCAGTIHLLMRLDRSGRAASEEAADLARLARDFLGDAHAAPPTDPAGRSPDRMTLDLGDGRTVEYQVRPGDLLRTAREGDKVRRREVYRRPSRTSARLDVTPDGPRSIAALILDRPADGPDGSLYRDYRIEAELGKDRRFIPRSP